MAGAVYITTAFDRTRMPCAFRTELWRTSVKTRDVERPPTNWPATNAVGSGKENQAIHAVTSYGSMKKVTRAAVTKLYGATGNSRSALGL